MKHLLSTRSLIGIVVIAASVSYAIGQEMRTTALAEADLGKHFESLEGWRLDMHRVVVPPGAGSKDHSHKDRPEVFYVLKGSVVETQGKDVHEYKAGEGFQSNAKMYEGLPHRIENLSATDAEVLVIEITSQPKVSR